MFSSRLSMPVLPLAKMSFLFCYGLASPLWSFRFLPIIASVFAFFLCPFSHNFLSSLFLLLLICSHLFSAAQVVEKGQPALLVPTPSRSALPFSVPHKDDHASPPLSPSPFHPLLYPIESSQTVQIPPKRVLMMKQMRQPPVKSLADSVRRSG